MASTNDSSTILVAVDFTEGSALAFEQAVNLAAQNPNARLHVVTVVPSVVPAIAELVPATWTGVGPTSDRTAEQLRSFVEVQLRRVREHDPSRALPAVEHIVLHVRLDAPAQEVAQLAADLEADLVVVGTHGRRGLPRVILGSVAETTVRLAPCPVLVVRPKALAAPGPTIEPPCPQCVKERQASGGRELWCGQHRERHGQRHTYHQSDRMGAQTNMPLVVRT